VGSKQAEYDAMHHPLMCGLTALAKEYRYKYKWEFVECGLQIVQGR